MAETQNKKVSLTTRVIIAMIFGATIGILLSQMPKDHLIFDLAVRGVFKVIGDIFVASLKMLVVPMVFVSLVCGVTNLKDIKQLGKVGSKTLGLYMLTTAMAVGMALLMATFLQPGVGFQISHTQTQFHPVDPPNLSEVIIDLVPSNPVRAAADGKMLQIIVFALLVGLGLTKAGEDGKKITEVFNRVNEVIMNIISMLMQIAPYGVAALMAKVFAEQGMDVLQPLLRYFSSTLALLIFHVLVTYPVILMLFARLNPIIFLRKMYEAMLFAFSTASSNATLPVTLRTVIDKLGVKEAIASFTVPLGATINMDGTAIMQGVATVFIAQVYQIPLSTSDFIMVVLTATLASIGTAGVPGVGLITLAMVLRQVGLPVEGIGLIIGVDRLLDMVRAAVNITGDASVSCIVAKSEGQFEKDAFYR